jgi:ribosomal protein L17
MNTQYQSEHEKGFTLQKIAEQRLDAAWTKAMTTQCGLEKLTEQKAKEAVEKLKQAMKLINDAKWIMLNLPAESCAAFHNEKGGYESAEEIVAKYRRPFRS